MMNQVMEDAYKHERNKDKMKTIVYVGDQHAQWQRTTVRPIRPMESVILEDDLTEKLLNDVQNYLSKESWYAARGIPYRRGYLLYGSPGCGKSSFVTALAGELKLNIYVINLASELLHDEVLAELLRTLPYRSILLFEDIDSAFVHGPEQESDSEGSDEGGASPVFHYQPLRETQPDFDPPWENRYDCGDRLGVQVADPEDVPSVLRIGL